MEWRRGACMRVQGGRGACWRATLATGAELLALGVIDAAITSFYLEIVLTLLILMTQLAVSSRRVRSWATQQPQRKQHPLMVFNSHSARRPRRSSTTRRLPRSINIVRPKRSILHTRTSILATSAQRLVRGTTSNARRCNAARIPNYTFLGE